MKFLCLLAVTLLFGPTVCLGQSAAASDELDTPDLRGFTREQLLACFDQWTVCDDHNSWDVSDELARRNDLYPLLKRYWKERSLFVRQGIEHMAYRSNSPEVSIFMKQILLKKVDDGEHQYYPVNYLAKNCDTVALEELSSGRYRNQGSLQYQTSLELFGRCKYRPAIPYLVGTALYDISFNIVIAADHSLHALYPDGPKDFDDMRTMQQYFCDRAHQEGFKVKCGAEPD